MRRPLQTATSNPVSGLRIGVRSFRLAVALGVVALCLLPAPQTALASHNQVALFQDDLALDNDPSGALMQMRELGVETVRVLVRWSLFAPDPTSRKEPNLNLSDPDAYPPTNWLTLDAIDRDAQADGIQVMFVPTAFAPLWAQGRNPGRYRAHNNNPYQAFEPSANAFGEFVTALGNRYSGTFTPAGSLTALPKVSTWELYNEPNFGEDLSPQAIDGSSVLWAPVMYRGLLDAGWSALNATGHGRDTILIGALAAHGQRIGVTRVFPQGLPGSYGETKPLSFILDLYCLGPNYKPYRGPAASVRHCPTTAAASRRFQAHNPALFRASGFSEHPYPANNAPTMPATKDPDEIDFSEIPRLYAALDRIQRAYGSRRRLPIWNTEYGYITNPPNYNKPSNTPAGSHYVSPTTAADYLNWAEYLSWRNPRIVSTMQYLLEDPNPRQGTPEYGGFASGLVFYRTVRDGIPKQTFYAYRMPLFLPRTLAQRGSGLEVWGAVRPAHYAQLDSGAPQYAQIQFSAGSTGTFQTLETVPITNAQGYFDVRLAFPSSGSIRVAYPVTDPAFGAADIAGYDANPLGLTFYSRTVQVTIG